MRDRPVARPDRAAPTRAMARAARLAAALGLAWGAWSLARPGAAASQEVVPETRSAATADAGDSTTLERARVRFDRGRFAAAVALLEPALGSDSAATPDRAAACELLGRSLVRLGDVEGAVVVFTRLEDLAPSWTMDPRRVEDDERAVFTRARLAWREAHPEYVRAEAEAAAHAALPRPWYRQRRVQLAGGLAAIVAFAVVRHQRQVDEANRLLPPLPGHP